MTVPEVTRPSRAAIVGNAVRWGAAGGLLTGWGHAALVMWQQQSGGFAWFSREFVWMAPMAYTILFVSVCVGLAALGMVWPSLGSSRVMVWVVTALGVFGLLLPYSQIATWASALAAVGAATQVARLVATRTRGANQAGTWVATGLALATLGAAFVVGTMRTGRERSALSALPTPSPGAPNVLLIILDTVRAASLSLYGYDVPTTPALSRWAAQGVTFDYAISPAPWTLPTHASIFTGAPASELSTQWVKPLDTTRRTLAEALRDKGYATAGVVANHAYTAWDSGLDRGFVHYADYLVSAKQMIRSTSYTQTKLFGDLRAAGGMAEQLRALANFGLSVEAKHTSARRTADLVTGHFLEWQAGIAGRPFFAFLNYYDAHLPYYSPATFTPVVKGTGARAAYENAIAWLDQSLDGLFKTLQERGVLDNTIVIVTSDHGELFQEFGLSGHAHNVYLNTIRVPLIIRYPARVPADVRVTQEVSLRDLPATIGALAGVGDLGLPGESLVPLWAGGARAGSPAVSEVGQAPNVPKEFPTATGSLVALLDSAHHYISSTDGTEHLFPYRDAANATTDLSGSGAPPLANLRNRLATLRPQHRRAAR